MSYPFAKSSIPWTALSWTLLCSVVIICGCDSRQSAGTQSAGTTANSDKALAEIEPPRVDISDDRRRRESDPASLAVTNTQAHEFVDQWRQAVLTNDLPAVNALIDWQSIFDRALSGIDVDDKFRSEFIRDTTSLESTQRLIGTIAKEVNEGGSYRLVNALQRGTRSHVTLRLLNAAGELNYHDFRLKQSDGNVVADQLFFASTGETFGDTMRTMFADALQQQDSTAGKISKEKATELKLLNQQSAMANAVRQGDNAKALALYDKMPSKLQQRKIPMLMRVLATNIDDEQAYLKSIADFDAQHPDDAAFGLITLDAAVFREDHVLLIKSRNQLQRFTGGDPYLDLMVGGVLANQGRADQAKAMTDPIDAATLELASAHDFKLSVAMATDDHGRTLQELRILRDDFGYELSNLDGIQGFEKFVASPEYQQWLEPTE